MPYRNVRVVVSAIIALIAAISAAHANCKAEVDAAFAKLRASEAFRLATKIVNEQGSLAMTVDFMPPDRMHQRITVGDQGAQMEMIVIGKKAWSNQGQGWAELPEKFSEQVAMQLRETVAEPPKLDAPYECLGEQDFEGKRYAAYRAKLAIPEQVKEKQGVNAAPNVQTVYVDKASGLPARNIVTAEVAPEKRLFDGTFSSTPDLKIVEPATSAQ